MNRGSDESGDFKETPVGRIPKGWVVKKYVEIFEFLNTANNPRQDLSERGDLKYIHYGDIHTNPSSFLDCAKAHLPYIDKKMVSRIPLLEDGDLVLVDASEDHEGLGKSVEIRNAAGCKTVAGLHTFLLRGNRKFLADGFKRYLQNMPCVKSSLIRVATGVSVYGVSKTNLKTIQIPLPPIPEQQKIAAILSTVDAVIAETDAVIAKTEQVKKGLMQELLTNGIGHTEFKETEIGRLPSEWDIVKIEEIAEFKNGINFSKEHKGQSGILTFDVLNMYEVGIKLKIDGLYRVNINISQSSPYLLKKGDILFVRSSLKREGAAFSTMFDGYNEPVTYCGFIIRARLNKSNVLPEFFTYYHRMDTTRNRLISCSGHSAITNISQENLKTIKFTIPPLVEQQKIVSILSEFDLKLVIEYQYRSTLKTFKQGLMQDLLTGRVRVKTDSEVAAHA